MTRSERTGLVQKYSWRSPVKNAGSDIQSPYGTVHEDGREYHQRQWGSISTPHITAEHGYKCSRCQPDAGVAAGELYGECEERSSTLHTQPPSAGWGDAERAAWLHGLRFTGATHLSWNPGSKLVVRNQSPGEAEDLSI